MNKKKIVCFHLYNDFSGSPKVLRRVVRGMLEEGHEVVLVTSRGGVLDKITDYRLQITDNSQLSILSPKAQRPSVLNSQLSIQCVGGG